MAYTELQGWNEYFEKRPVGWRDDDRAFKHLQTQGVKGEPYSVFSSLLPIYKPTVTTDGTLNASSLKGSALFSRMLSAKGGDKLDL
jgi:hypothetical protein